MKPVSIIVAIDNKRGIAKDGKIPWDDPDDRKLFKEITTRHHSALIMGKVTASTLTTFPLPGRKCVVLTRDQTLNSVFKSLDADKDVEEIFIIGGEVIYNLSLQHPRVNTIYLTKIPGDFKCDRFFKYDHEEWHLDEVEHMPTNISKYYYILHRNNDEHKYLTLVSHILENGVMMEDRTGTGTLVTLGHMIKYNIRNGKIPFLTTKHVSTRAVIEELLWMLRGQTNSKILESKGVKIWKENSSREYLDKYNFRYLRGEKKGEKYVVGDCGPVYGFQMRHSGAEYLGCWVKHSGGVDQVKKCLHEIKNNPNSRQIIINLGNPSQVPEMVLPPCHVLYQFVVMGGELHCKMDQRSCDVGLGVPFNIASASILTHIFARLCNLRPGELIHSMGHTHIYRDHIDVLRQQTSRQAYGFPSIRFNGDFTIDNIDTGNIEIVDYVHHGKLNMKMSA